MKLSNSSTFISEDKNSISVFPNPASYEFIINNDLSSRLEIYDILGKPVMNYNLFKGMNFLNRKNLKNGVYILKFYSLDSLISTEKIIFE